MDEFSTEIIGVQNDSKRIVEDTQSERLPIASEWPVLADVQIVYFQQFF